MPANLRDEDEKQKRLLASAMLRLQALERKECFDPGDPKSRPTPAQKLVLEEFGKIRHQYIRAGNQGGKCIPAGTLVLTPKGPIPIKDIEPGDIVYSEFGTEIRVLRKFHQGIQEVADLTHKGRVIASCTSNHRWLVRDSHGREQIRHAGRAVKGDLVKRVNVKSSLGNIRVPQAYVLGVLLGDGCSRQGRRDIHLSSGISVIPETCAAIIGNTARKLHKGNYTWSIGKAEIPYYTEWCKGRYAHEKIVDLDIIKTWDRISLLEFVAGLIDSDGSLSFNLKAKTLNLSLNMQSKSIIEAFKYACLALWQVEANYRVDMREKYVNGPVHIAYITNPRDLSRIYKELNSLIKSTQKKWKEQYTQIDGKRTSEYGVGLVWGDNSRLEDTYDIEVDSHTHLFLLANGLVTHNSTVMARNISWILTGDHPYWKRPPEWLTEPLLILIAGRTGKQIEDSLLPRLIGYLDPSTYKVVKIGNIVQRLEMTNGDRVIFQSLENPDMARERLQSYTAHIAWVDELPPTLGILSELHRRVQAKNGIFLASFTPLTPNFEIQQYIDSVELRLPGYAKVYRLNMLDNPVYASETRRIEILKSVESLPDRMRNAVLYGDWVSGDENVYDITPKMLRELPPYYSPVQWRHVESVDPAMESATGVTIWAEDPKTAEWYCILAEYITGHKDPISWVHAVHKISSKYNIVRRVSDVAPWFTTTAYSELKVIYNTVHGKSGRKLELIASFQGKLGNRLYLVPTKCHHFLREAQDYRWSEKTEGKIINSQAFHLLDTGHYFSDNIPSAEVKAGGLMGDGIQADTWVEWLWKANDRRKAANDSAEKKKEARKQAEQARSKLGRIKMTSRSRIW